MSKFADELTELGFDEWSEEEGLTDADMPDFLDSDLPCFFLVQIPQFDVTFVVDEYRRVWAADGLIDLSHLGFKAMELLPDEGDEDEEPRPRLQ